MPATPFDTAAVKSYLTDLQARIVAALEAADGLPFRTDTWERSPTPPSPQLGEGDKAEPAFN
ncbi:MAG: coproporphyrinogen III oxidase, partial [Thiobacillus sp.]|nr:coproporphyrinogen III oxidase [Thiobacillus sp.]